MNPCGFILLFYTSSLIRSLTFNALCRFLEIVGTFRIMFSKRPILLILLQLSCLLCKTQQASFIKYTVYDGLVANPIRCIYQDSKGFIWIGTFEGMSRYDGYKFTNYTASNGLSHNMINSFFETEGKVLIAENNGAIDVMQNNSIIKGLKAASAVNIIWPYKDRVLVSTDGNGFYEYRNDTIILPAQEQTGIAVGHFIPLNDSLLLSAGVDDDLIVYRNDLSVHSTLKNLNFHFYSLFRDSKNRVWACTAAGLKLLEIHAGKKVFLSFAPLPPVFDFSPLNNSPVTSMIEDKDGSFWIGTMKGLVRLFPGGNFHVHNEKDGLPSAIINTLFRDKENNLWIGTALGLAKWVARNHVVFYNTEHKQFRNDVNAIFSSNNKKIILTAQNGLQYFDVESKEFKTIKPVTKNFFIPVSRTSPLLIHYGDTLAMLNIEKNALIPVEKLDHNVPGVIFSCRHPDGTTFFGTYQGLYAAKKTLVKKILPYRVTSLVIDNDGNVWAGTWVDGLYRITINNNDDTTYHVQNLTNIIGQEQIRGLYADSKNNIWVGTRYGGAYCLTPKATGNYNVQRFGRQSGLMCDWVNSFAETKAGDIWIGSYLGLDKLVKEPSGYRVFNFSKAVNFFAEIRGVVSAGDNDWVCLANRGIATFKDENLHQARPLQATILSTGLGVLDNKLTILSPTEKIYLKPRQNAARFEFSALGFINERQILYSYRLKGSNDTTWSKPENIHEATYASLAPGAYRFEVKTIGWNGEHGIPATLSFYISSPFWKQWWFIALSFLAVLILLYGLYRYRIRQLVRLQNVRNSIATDLHDDIGSSLTNISILSELSTKHLAQPDKAEPFLQRISEEVQASSQAMDDIIWSVNSRNDSLQETMARMRRHAAELFDNSDTNCYLQLDENTGNKKLSMEQRRDVYLIYKEALNNIHKHAAARNIWIDVRQNQNHLFMQVKDDGKGFNTKLITHRNGLKNLRSRVEKWIGKIQIHSEENKGTTIEIKIPIKE